MKSRSLSLLAMIALVAPIALFPVSAMAAQKSSEVSPESHALIQNVGDPPPGPEVLQSDFLFDQDELAELAALESENVDLQQLEAGFFGPRIGTIIVIAILLIVLL